MSRNAISANPEHYIFKIFRGSMPPDPPRRPKTIFSCCRVAQKIFSGSTSPRTKNPRQYPVYRQIFQSASSIKFLTIKLFRILNLSKIRKINLIF